MANLMSSISYNRRFIVVFMSSTSLKNIAGPNVRLWSFEPDEDATDAIRTIAFGARASRRDVCRFMAAIKHNNLIK
jgi:hypothetical protein